MNISWQSKTWNQIHSPYPINYYKYKYKEINKPVLHLIASDAVIENTVGANAGQE